MKTEHAIEFDIRKIHRSLKRVRFSDLKAGDQIFMGWTGDPFATPFDIEIKNGKSCVFGSGISLSEIEHRQDYQYCKKVGPKVAKRLFSLQDELQIVTVENKRLKDEQERTGAHLRRLTEERYVVWNYVYDFNGVEDRDGFLVEIYDGRGKNLLRQIWATMESNEDLNGCTLCGEEDVELLFVRQIAKVMTDSENSIEPVIVYCDKID